MKEVLFNSLLPDLFIGINKLKTCLIHLYSFHINFYWEKLAKCALSNLMFYNILGVGIFYFCIIIHTC